ncbi:hypothetical protein C8Q76DRAFT_631555 [Earliella scabrosa]|nr:hypothetical protein C8Q76DRAFT_631555 [Earliella scabrosa]
MVVWAPVWKTFVLKAFRGMDWKIIQVQAEWHDPDLLRVISRTYNDLRTWRRWISLKDISIPQSDHTVIFPRRLEYVVVPSKNQRLRHFLGNPDELKGRRDFMVALTKVQDIGIEFVEDWALRRFAVAVILLVIASLAVGVGYSFRSGDAGDAFTIAGYMTSAYSVCLVMLGVLNFVEI